MLRNPRAEIGCSLKEGETGDVSDELGTQLVNAGLAVDVSPPEQRPQKIKAVPQEAALKTTADAGPKADTGGNANADSKSRATAKAGAGS